MSFRQITSLDDALVRNVRLAVRHYLPCALVALAPCAGCGGPGSTAEPTTAGGCSSGIEYQGRTYDASGSGQVLGLSAETHVAAVRQVSDSLQIYLHEAAALCDLHRTRQLTAVEYVTRRTDLAERFGMLVRLSQVAPSTTRPPEEVAAFAEATSRLTPSGAPENVELQATLESLGKALPSPAVLKSGDGFALRLKPQGATWIYVLLVDSSGATTRLYPARLTGTENPVSRELVVPSDGARELYLDDHPGRERIFVYASTRRVDSIERLVGEVAEGGAAAPGTLKAEVAGRVAGMLTSLGSGDLGNTLKSKFGLAAAELTIEHR